MQQQPQRAAAVRLAQIEREAVRLGKALKLRQRKIADVAMRQQIGQHIVAMLIPRARGRTRILLLLTTTLNAGYGGFDAKYSLG